MSGDRSELESRVLDEWEAVYDNRPDDPAEVLLVRFSHDGSLVALHHALLDLFEINDDEDEGLEADTLEELIDFLHARWDGELP